MPAEIAATNEVWWSLFTRFTIVGLIVAGGVALFYLYSILKYKARDTPEDVGVPREKSVTRMLVETKPMGISKVLLFATGLIVLTLIVSTIGDTVYLEFTPTEDALPIWVTGFQFGWSFDYYVGGEKVTTTGYVVLPADTVVEFKVTSRDVFHNFGIPEFKVKIDAIPGILNRMWVKTPSKPAVYTAYCYELCGVGHSLMTAKVIVVDKGEFFNAFNQGPEAFKACLEKVRAEYGG